MTEPLFAQIIIHIDMPSSDIKKMSQYEKRNDVREKSGCEDYNRATHTNIFQVHVGCQNIDSSCI